MSAALVAQAAWRPPSGRRGLLDPPRNMFFRGSNTTTLLPDIIPLGHSSRPLSAHGLCHVSRAHPPDRAAGTWRLPRRPARLLTVRARATGSSRPGSRTGSLKRSGGTSDEGRGRRGWDERGGKNADGEEEPWWRETSWQQQRRQESGLENPWEGGDRNFGKNPKPGPRFSSSSSSSPSSYSSYSGRGGRGRGRSSQQDSSRGKRYGGERRSDERRPARSRGKEVSRMLPEGMIEVPDPEGGPPVLVVCGPDGDRPNLTAADLTWQPVIGLRSGNVSDDRLWKVFEGDEYVGSGDEDWDDEEEGGAGGEGAGERREREREERERRGRGSESADDKFVAGDGDSREEQGTNPRMFNLEQSTFNLDPSQASSNPRTQAVSTWMTTEGERADFVPESEELVQERRRVTGERASQIGEVEGRAKARVRARVPLLFTRGRVAAAGVGSNSSGSSSSSTGAITSPAAAAAAALAGAGAVGATLAGIPAAAGAAAAAEAVKEAMSSDSFLQQQAREEGVSEIESLGTRRGEEREAGRREVQGAAWDQEKEREEGDLRAQANRRAARGREGGRIRPGTDKEGWYGEEDLPFEGIIEIEDDNEEEEGDWRNDVWGEDYDDKDYDEKDYEKEDAERISRDNRSSNSSSGSVGSGKGSSVLDRLRSKVLRGPAEGAGKTEEGTRKFPVAKALSSQDEASSSRSSSSSSSNNNLRSAVATENAVSKLEDEPLRFRDRRRGLGNEAETEEEEEEKEEESVDGESWLSEGEVREGRRGKQGKEAYRLGQSATLPSLLPMSPSAELSSSSSFSASSSKVPLSSLLESPVVVVSERSNYDRELEDEFFSRSSFVSAGASPEAAAALTALGARRPSHIQAIAYRPVLEGRTCIVADQTGSGKTLAYLAPLLQRLRMQEKQQQQWQQQQKQGQQQQKQGLQQGGGGGGGASGSPPKVVVLVPTAELAGQVLRVCRGLAKAGLPVRSLALTGGHKWRTQVESLRNGADVIIATPGRLLQHLDEATVVLDSVQSLVVDEADILFDDEDFAHMLRPIRLGLPSTAQFVHVSATLPEDVHRKLLAAYPGAVSVIGPSLHRTAAGLQEILVDCSKGGPSAAEERTPEEGFARKRAALLRVLGLSDNASKGRESEDEEGEEKGDVRRGRRGSQREQSGLANGSQGKTIIFCNKIETCRKVENALRRVDRQGKRVEVVAYHAALSQEKRQEALDRLRDLKPSAKPLILVCTDRASRGVDSIDVDRVVLFDFPRDPSEYVRRVGRTARGAGGTGTVYVLVLGGQVGLARRIMSRNDRGLPVHKVLDDYF